MKQETWFFLRGLIRESAHWEDFLKKFAADFPERKVVALDLPGVGIRSQEKCPLSVASIVDRLRPEFLEKKSSENFIFAVSLGAMVAAEWMRRYPEDFCGGVLANTSTRMSPFFQRLIPSAILSVLKLFFSLSPLRREENILRLTSNRKEGNAELAQRWAKMAELRPVSRITALRQLLAAATFSPPRTTPHPNILLMNSLGDRLCSPFCSEKLAEVWNLKLKTHPNAGHDLTLDDPDWVVNVLKEAKL
jgi:pimeloyl-ACP methyl ester carboxylesterase